METLPNYIISEIDGNFTFEGRDGSLLYASFSHGEWYISLDIGDWQRMPIVFAGRVL